MVELRRFNRAPLEQKLEFADKGADAAERIEGMARDISVGGMFVETDFPAAFGAAIVVYIKLPAEKKELVLPAIVRWTKSTGMGVQFGLIGARETHAITEVVKARDSVA